MGILGSENFFLHKNWLRHTPFPG